MDITALKPFISWSDFEKIDIRSGTIMEAIPFPKARKPAYQLKVDFGDLGIKKSSAQITDLYLPEELVGMQVLAVVNFPPKQIADFMSECLVLGIYAEAGKVVLISPERNVPNGAQMG
ncbi:MAG: tRNA-binding protein [Saprospiraceae bacterium]|nr:tRNA-binding protein [Saprospiraceae bacterium]